MSNTTAKIVILLIAFLVLTMPSCGRSEDLSGSWVSEILDHGDKPSVQYEFLFSESRLISGKITIYRQGSTGIPSDDRTALKIQSIVSEKNRWSFKVFSNYNGNVQIDKMDIDNVIITSTDSIEMDLKQAERVPIHLSLKKKGLEE